MKNVSIDGFLVIDKPEGNSSAFIDHIIKRKFGANRVGHIGTLDPFATGVLAVAINAGTKAIPYIKQSKKIYEFEIMFGSKTDTADKTGKIIDSCGRIPTTEEIIQILPKFIGKIQQVPSIYSAIKINGKKSYELARNGEIPNIPERTVEIYNLEMVEEHKFKAEVSPGTYIRTLTEDIAKALGTVAYTASLRRIQDGKFSIKDGITIDKLDKIQDNISDILITLENVLDDIPVILISCQDAENLIVGRCIHFSIDIENGIYLAKADNGFLEIIELLDGVIHPKKLLRYF